MSLAKSAFSFASPAGMRSKLSIFIFHRVLPEKDYLLPWEPDRRQFDSIVRFISGAFNVLTLTEATDRLEAGTLPPAPAVITFDDGYADNYTEAREILLKYGVPATFFIATAFLDGGRMWNDDVIEAVRQFRTGVLDLEHYELGKHQLNSYESRVRCYGEILRRLKHRPHGMRQEIAREIARSSGLVDHSTLMMTSKQLKALSHAGMEIGAHTHSHPILASLPDHESEEEIVFGLNRLKEIIGKPVEVFAYPNGEPGRDYDSRHVDMVKRAGFQAAVSTRPGVANQGEDLHQLPRFTPWDRTIIRFALRSFLHLWRN